MAGHRGLNMMQRLSQRKARRLDDARTALESMVRERDEKIAVLQKQRSIERDNFFQVQSELEKLRALHEKEKRVHIMKRDVLENKISTLETELKLVKEKNEIDPEMVLKKYSDTLRKHNPTTKNKKAFVHQIQNHLCFAIHKMECQSSQIRLLKSKNEEFVQGILNDYDSTLKERTTLESSLQTQICNLQNDIQQSNELHNIIMENKVKSIQELEQTVDEARRSHHNHHSTPLTSQQNTITNKPHLSPRRLVLSPEASDPRINTSQKKLQQQQHGTLNQNDKSDVTDLSLTLQAVKNQLSIVADEKENIVRALEQKEKDYNDFITFLGKVNSHNDQMIERLVYDYVRKDSPSSSSMGSVGDLTSLSFSSSPSSSSSSPTSSSPPSPQWRKGNNNKNMDVMQGNVNMEGVTTVLSETSLSVMRKLEAMALMAKENMSNGTAVTHGGVYHTNTHDNHVVKKRNGGGGGIGDGDLDLDRSMATSTPNIFRKKNEVSVDNSNHGSGGLFSRMKFPSTTSSLIVPPVFTRENV